MSEDRSERQRARTGANLRDERSREEPGVQMSEDRSERKRARTGATLRDERSRKEPGVQ
jgi:hypothetical protein